jgi:hypothetical protein
MGGLKVAMLANSVMRLSHKMRQSHGHLPHDEQAQLYHHMHLLDDVYLQLQVTATLPASTSAVAHDTYQRSEAHHQQDCHSGGGPATTLAHDVSAHDGRPCSPGAVGGRRRTKRQFTKRCGRCDTSYTSQWRTGPSGPSTYVLTPPPHHLALHAPRSPRPRAGEPFRPVGSLSWPVSCLLHTWSRLGDQATRNAHTCSRYSPAQHYNMFRLCNACGIRYARHARQAFQLGQEHARHSLPQSPESPQATTQPPTTTTTTTPLSRNSIGFLLN